MNNDVHLLRANRGIRSGWTEQVGRPHAKGVRLNVAVSLAGCTHDGIDYQVRGVVDVPSPPYGDDERNYLAGVLLREVGCLREQKYEYYILDWVDCDGGDGIRVHSWRDVEATPITDDAIVGDIETFEPPDFERPVSFDLEKHTEWTREYEANEYLRFESRKEINQRYQDVLVNLQILQLSGKMGQTDDPRWHRLLQHLLVQMDADAELPSPWNLHPEVEKAMPFFDGETCRKAADVVARRSTTHDVIVKYGKREHMERLLWGEVYLNSATNYNDSMHNQAVRDDELAIDFKGGCVRALHPTQYYSSSNAPPSCVAERARGFRPIFNCPDLAEREYATTTVRMTTDYWMFCAAGVLDPRLFADFAADCCVIVMRRPFVELLAKRVPPQLPNVKMHIGHVQYVDPLGAFSPGMVASPSMAVHMTKTFRYSYQREVRFVCLPNTPAERLEPRKVQIGSLMDFAELVPLP